MRYRASKRHQGISITLWGNDFETIKSNFFPGTNIRPYPRKFDPKMWSFL